MRRAVDGAGDVAFGVTASVADVDNLDVGLFVLNGLVNRFYGDLGCRSERCWLVSVIGGEEREGGVTEGDGNKEPFFHDGCLDLGLKGKGGYGWSLP